jgi:hypothetical protein
MPCETYVLTLIFASLAGLAGLAGFLKGVPLCAACGRRMVWLIDTRAGTKLAHKTAAVPIPVCGTQGGRRDWWNDPDDCDDLRVSFND